jgi:hypothetical protein
MTISTSRSARLALVAVVCLCLNGARGRAQIHYDTGQNVVPVFEGWERNDDGSFNMVFGYMNRNYAEELDVPIGPDNHLEPGDPDQGQPTHFYTRRQQFVFKVHVPADWGQKDLVWTLNVGGRPEKAYASLLPFWQLGPLVYEENRGGIAQIGAEPEPNEPPTIAFAGPPPASVAAGQPVTIGVSVADDGHPEGRPSRVRRNADGSVATATGTPGPGASGPQRENPLTQAIVRNEPGVALGVTWIVYRGATAGVTIAPAHQDVENGLASVTVTFAHPGHYTLRAYADDTVYVTPIDVVIDVRRPGL